MMTGRELIAYILENGLEDEPVFKDGRFIAFMTAGEAAEKMHVGVATICAWVAEGMLTGVIIGDILYIPVNSESPIDKNKQREE